MPAFAGGAASTAAWWATRGRRCGYPGNGHDIEPQYHPLAVLLRRAGLRTVTISPFADRHMVWWFLAGFSEVIDPGVRGNEIAPQVTAHAIPWLQANGAKDNWFVISTIGMRTGLTVRLWSTATRSRTSRGRGATR